MFSAVHKNYTFNMIEIRSTTIITRFRYLTSGMACNEIQLQQGNKLIIIMPFRSQSKSQSMTIVRHRVGNCERVEKVRCNS